MRRVVLNGGLISAVLCFSLSGFSWGPTGHRITAEMASRNLQPKPLNTCMLVLNGYSLADIANVLDEERSSDDPPPTALHFVNMDQDSYQASTKSPEGDAVLATQLLFKYLKTRDPRVLDPIPQLKERIKNDSDALTYLVHLVGDLHQPLHVGKASDQGGNKVTVKFMGKQTSLHVVWDSLMIDQTKYSYTEFTEYLNHVTPEQRKAWENPQNLSIDDLIVSWANESWQVTKNLVYNFPDPQPETTPGHDAPIPVLGYKYIYDTKPVLDEQLAKGGIRLAYLLSLLY